MEPTVCHFSVWGSFPIPPQFIAHIFHSHGARIVLRYWLDTEDTGWFLPGAIFGLPKWLLEPRRWDIHGVRAHMTTREQQARYLGRGPGEKLDNRVRGGKYSTHVILVCGPITKDQ